MASVTAAVELEHSVRAWPAKTSGDPMATETIAWQKDVDAALAQAARDNRPLLLDFTAAPA